MEIYTIKNFSYDSDFFNYLKETKFEDTSISEKSIYFNLDGGRVFIEDIGDSKSRITFDIHDKNLLINLKDKLNGEIKIKTFYFTKNEYYGRVIPHLQKIADYYNISDSIFYEIEPNKDSENNFEETIGREYFHIKTPKEFFGIEKSNSSKFKVKINTYDIELINNLEKISRG